MRFTPASIQFTQAAAEPQDVYSLATPRQELRYVTAMRRAWAHPCRGGRATVAGAESRPSEGRCCDWGDNDSSRVAA